MRNVNLAGDIAAKVTSMPWTDEDEKRLAVYNDLLRVQQMRVINLQRAIRELQEIKDHALASRRNRP